jgi:hypothetical protein
VTWRSGYRELRSLHPHAPYQTSDRRDGEFTEYPSLDRLPWNRSLTCQYAVSNRATVKPKYLK